MLPCLLFSGCSKPENDGQTRITRFIADLDSSDLEVRREAMYQLEKSPAELGRQKEPVEIALRKRFLSEKDSYARWYAALALLEIDFTSNKDFIFSSLLEEIEGPSAETREFAADHLWSFARKLSETEKETAISALTKHLQDESAPVRYAAAISLGQMNPARFQNLILPMLVELVNADTADLQNYKVQAIFICENIGPAAAEAVPGIVKFAKKDSRGADSRFIDLYIAAVNKIGGPESAGAQQLEQMRKGLQQKAIAANSVVLVFFALLFGWGVRLRRRGRKVFHWFILFPFTLYLARLIGNFSGDLITLDSGREYLILLIFTSVGLVPWLISWLLLRRRLLRERK